MNITESIEQLREYGEFWHEPERDIVIPFPPGSVLDQVWMIARAQVLKQRVSEADRTKNWLVQAQGQFVIEHTGGFGWVPDWRDVERLLHAEAE